MKVNDPMYRGVEALAILQEIARTPNHNRMISGDRATDIVMMVELYRAVIAQNQITEQELLDVRRALALHKSMVLGGEYPTETSNKLFDVAMKTMDRVKSGADIATCCECGCYHERGKMKVQESFAKASEIGIDNCTLMCLNCWQAYLQTELGMLRVHAIRVTRTKNRDEMQDALQTLGEFLDDHKKRRKACEVQLIVGQGGRMTGDLPCGHAVSNIVNDETNIEAPYCAACFNS